MSDNDDENYEVGYGKPPKKTQFGAENGNQRNNKGRPPGRNVVEYDRLSEEALWHCIHDTVQKPVSYIENNEEHIVPLIMLITKQMANDAAKGDRHARRDILKYTEKATKGIDKLKLEMHSIIMDHKNRVFEGMQNPGSLKCYEACYYWFRVKRNLRDLDGEESWIYEDDEPITDEDWKVLSDKYEYLKGNPTETLPWPPKYPSVDPEDKES